MRHALPLFMVLAGLFAAGCTTSIDVGSDGQAGGLSTTGGGVGVGVGSVSVNEGVTVAPLMPVDSTVNAQFWGGPDGTNGVSTTSQIGPCAITVFTTEPVLGSRVYQSVGTISISGLDEPVSLAPTASDPGVYLPFVSPSNNLFSGGESLTVSATGAAVPAFTATLVAPSVIDLQSPGLANGVQLELDRSADLTFAWSGGGFGSVAVSFVDAPNTTVSCTFPQSAGTGTIPKAAFAALAPKGEGGLQFEVESDRTVTIGGWSVLLVAQSAVLANGVLLDLPISYQASN